MSKIATVTYDPDRQLYFAHVDDKKVAQSKSFLSLELNLIQIRTGKKAQSLQIESFDCVGFTRDEAIRRESNKPPKPNTGTQVSPITKVATSDGIRVSMIECDLSRKYTQVTTPIRNKLCREAYSLHHDSGYTISEIVDHMMATYPHSREQITAIINKAI